VVQSDGAGLLRWSRGTELGVSVAVTTREGGVSTGPYRSLNLGLHVGDDVDRVLENRARAARAFGVDLVDVIFPAQVHGTATVRVGNAERGRGTTSLESAIEGADALVTTAGATLTVLVADCVPLALVDPEAGVLAVVHAGWRGTGGAIVRSTLSVMEHQGARAERTWAFLGPAVAPDLYQVDAVVHRALEGALGPAGLDAHVMAPDGAGHWRCDLVAANIVQLVAGGLDESRIEWCGVATSDGRFFSDRSERPCGRFALLAQLER